MPTPNPTGFETYIYDHKAFPNSDDDYREHRPASHDNSKLPPPTCDQHTAPLIMVEPCYAHNSKDIFLHFRGITSMNLSRRIAEQLRDALILVCQQQ